MGLNRQNPVRVFNQAKAPTQKSALSLATQVPQNQFLQVARAQARGLFSETQETLYADLVRGIALKHQFIAALDQNGRGFVDQLDEANLEVAKLDGNRGKLHVFKVNAFRATVEMIGGEPSMEVLQMHFLQPMLAVVTRSSFWSCCNLTGDRPSGRFAYSRC